jgi:hypothetical protein
VIHGIFGKPGTVRSMIENLAMIAVASVCYARTESLNEASFWIVVAAAATMLFGYDLGKRTWWRPS